MTAATFADLAKARPLGRNRWQAKCPAHPDKSPSLAINEGRDGRVLVRCWAGCETGDILAALNLTMRDLFSGEPLNPLAIQQAHRERLEREEIDRQHAEVERQLATIVRRLHFAVNALGPKLAHASENDALAETFHAACDWLHIAESGLGEGAGIAEHVDAAA